MKHTRKLPFIIIGLVAWVFIISFGRKEFSWELKSSDSLFAEKVNNPNKKDPVSDILIKIKDNKIEEALSSILLLESDNNSEPVKEYFNDFRSYYNADQKQKNVLPLINNMVVIKRYYQQQGFNETESISRAEIIPFFCIKKFELSKKPNVLNTICDNYLSNTESNHISEQTAVIICLKIRTLYKKEGIGKTNDYIKDIEEKITAYQNRYQTELGSKTNSTYSEEAEYLNRFKKLCENIRNKHVFDKYDRLVFDMSISKLGE